MSIEMLLLLLLAESAPSSQVFVEQGVAPGARTEVLMLRPDGAIKASPASPNGAGLTGPIEHGARLLV